MRRRSSIPAAARSWRTPRLALALAFCSMIAYTAVMTLFPMSNNDIWIHLTTGEYVFRNGWVPLKDEYSFTATDHDYLAHEWLAAVLFYGVYVVGGVTGLILFKAAVVGTSCGLLLRTAWILRSRLSVILPAFTSLLYIASARFLERPHIFSYLMAALYLWLFFSYREGSRDRRHLYAILPAQVVWTNLHGGYVAGILMVGTFALGEGLAFARARHLRTGRDQALAAGDLALLALMVPGSILATLVNPYGYRLLAFPFELTSLDTFMAGIYEWQPPYAGSYNASTMFILYLVQMAALCAAFFIAQQGGTRSSGAESRQWVNVIFLAMLLVPFLALTILWFEEPSIHWRPDLIAKCLFFVLGLFSLFTILHFRSVDFTLAGIFVLFFMLSLQHNRAVTDAAMATFIVLTSAASAVLDRRSAGASSTRPRRVPPAVSATEAVPGSARPRWRDLSRPTSIVAGSVLMLAVSAYTAIFSYYLDFSGVRREKGFGIAANMPVCAVNFIERNHITGNAFVSYQFAGMLIHRMHPDVKVNMDSRNDVYGEELYLEYLGALRSPEAMASYLDRYPVDFFLLSNAERSPAVLEDLESSGEWVPVYSDTGSVIEVKRTPKTEALIKRHALKVIRPSGTGTEITASNARQVLEEAERLIDACPTSLFAMFYRTNALLALGRYEESLTAARRIVALDPANAQGHAGMGLAYLGLKQRDRAIDALERALKLDPSFQAAKDALRTLRGF